MGSSSSFRFPSPRVPAPSASSRGLTTPPSSPSRVTFASTVHPPHSPNLKADNFSTHVGAGQAKPSHQINLLGGRGGVTDDDDESEFEFPTANTHSLLANPLCEDRVEHLHDGGALLFPLRLPPRLRQMGKGKWGNTDANPDSSPLRPPLPRRGRGLAGFRSRDLDFDPFTAALERVRMEEEEEDALRWDRCPHRRVRSLGCMRAPEVVDDEEATEKIHLAATWITPAREFDRGAKGGKAVRDMAMMMVKKRQHSRRPSMGNGMFVSCLGFGQRSP